MNTGAEQSNPLAEVALALAMGFFSILVLALVSMGGGEGTSTTSDKDIFNVVAQSNKQDHSPQDKERKAVTRENTLIFHQGRFYDGFAKAVSPDRYAGKELVILAVSANETIVRAVAAKAKVKAKKVLLTTLPENWEKALNIQ